MSKHKLDKEKISREQELKIQRQIAFASGLFQGDVTIRTLLESLTEGVIIIDNSGTILLVNTAAEQMFGYQSKELIGKSQAVLIPERFLKVHEEHEAGYFKKPMIKPMGRLLDIAGRRRDGSEFPVEISLSFIDTINGVLVLALVSDITLRKQFEERLRKSEEQFHLQVEGVQDYATFTLDTEGNVLNWNAGAERLKGYRAEEIIGEHFSCFYPDEDRNAGKPEEELKKATVEGRLAYEGWRICKDGSRFWADVIITALYDESGNLRGFSKVTHDISGRKKAADALRVIEDRYRALFHDNPTMIVTLGADLTMISVNPFCASQLGYTTDELEGKSVLMVFHEDDRTAVTEQLRLCLQNPNQANRWQYRKLCKDGRVLWVEETAQAVYDLAGALNLLVVCQDVTERRRVEEALKNSEEKLRYALTAADIGSWNWDLANNELTWSERCNEFFGFPPGYLITYGAFLQSIHEEDRQRIDQAVTKSIQEKTEYFAEMRVVLPDGQVCWLMAKGRGFYDDHGKPIRMHGIVMDITASKQAEDALRLSEERYRRLYNETPVMLHSIDQDERLISVSNYWLETLCYERSEVLGRFSSEFLSAASRSYATEVVLPDFFRTGSCKEVPYQIVKKNGEVIDVLLSAVAERDSVGKIVRSLAVMTDVTERKRAAEALRKSEHKFLTVFHVVPALLGITTIAEGIFIDVNETCMRILGYQRDEVIGHTSLELGIWESQTERDRAMRALEEHGTVRDMEINLSGKTGDKLVGLLSAEFIDIDGEQYILSMINDITERKRAEAEHERLFLQLEAVMESINEGVVISDLEGNVLTMNKEALALHEYEKVEQVRQHLSEFRKTFELIDLEGRPVSLEQWPTARAIRGERFTDYEVHVRRKDTGKLWLGSYNGSPVFNKSGEIFLSVVTIRDITERKFAEEEIKRLNVSLTARAVDLEYANQELEAFNYTVAHDLRNPLNVVSSYCQVFKELCSDNLDEKCMRYLQETYDGTLRMNRLIEALLNFSQMAHAKLNRGSVDLSIMAKEVAEELKVTQPARQVMFLIADGLVADGDAVLLRVVLTNLFGNAWKYTAMLEEAVIEFGTKEIDGKQVYFVRDNGPGFDNAVAEKIFAPFQRLPDTEEFRGFGIGLATVERIIRRHGGRVCAEGEPGKGATFYFTLSPDR
jgi:PAS domain S-box-containing protein